MLNNNATTPTMRNLHGNLPAAEKKRYIVKCAAHGVYRVESDVFSISKHTDKKQYSDFPVKQSNFPLFPSFFLSHFYIQSKRLQKYQ